MGRAQCLMETSSYRPLLQLDVYYLSLTVISHRSLTVKPKITIKTTVPVILTEGDTRTLLCVASGTPKPLITWIRDNTKVQQDPNNSNYIITSANKNHAGTYRCEAVVTAPGLGPYRTNYTVAVTVRCKYLDGHNLSGFFK